MTIPAFVVFIFSRSVATGPYVAVLLDDVPSGGIATNAISALIRNILLEPDRKNN